MPPPAAAAAAADGAAALFSLLRGILRLHRQRLPPPMRGMGDKYVLAEFRRHLQGKTTEPQWRTFAAEWQHYAAMLKGTGDQQGSVAASGSGGGGGAAASVTAALAAGSKETTEQLLEQLNPEQQQQLIKLQKEAMALGADMLQKAARGTSKGSGGSGSGPAGAPPK
ncbi:hypothetical protein D9Q98_002480 [Chlorella vulgaris]|uniref:Succinate dehydrogenase assembly factor 3 n=1 Tax=Chlorella vulgaris TaxID=3077 RepID=A0A9D4TTF1_CHLVU|nr:hypothetical protein D9Q98_002480 [Chlorella vulgaris]